MSNFVPFWWDGNRFRRDISTPELFAEMKKIYGEEEFKKARLYKPEFSGDLPRFGFRLACQRLEEGAKTFWDWAQEQGLDLAG